MIRIRQLTAADRAWARRTLERHWESAIVVSRMRLYRVDRLPGFVAYRSGRPSGLLTYNLEGRELQVVTIQSLVPRVGVGAALLGAARDFAKALGCRRLWLVTTNENFAAISFYTRCGMALVATHRGAVRQARRLKPQIPEFGPDGTPIEDELEFEMRFDEAAAQQGDGADDAVPGR